MCSCNLPSASLPTSASHLDTPLPPFARTLLPPRFGRHILTAFAPNNLHLLSCSQRSSPLLLSFMTSCPIADLTNVLTDTSACHPYLSNPCLSSRSPSPDRRYRILTVWSTMAALPPCHSTSTMPALPPSRDDCECMPGYTLASSGTVSSGILSRPTSWTPPSGQS